MVKNSYIAHVEEDPDTRELFLVFPEGLLDQVGWKIGDDIRWIDNKDGTWSLKKVEHDGSNTSI